jgi:hypothetical protein
VVEGEEATEVECEVIEGGIIEHILICHAGRNTY